MEKILAYGSGKYHDDAFYVELDDVTKAKVKDEKTKSKGVEGLY